MKKPKWAASLQTLVWAFNVERGLAVFIRTPLNQGIRFDYGKSQEFDPSEFIQEALLPHLSHYKGDENRSEVNKIAQTILSHPHADHIAGIGRIPVGTDDEQALRSALHTCPHDKNPEPNLPDERLDWQRVGGAGSDDELLDRYKALYKNRNLPLQTIKYEPPPGLATVPNLEYAIYYFRPPKVAVEYPNDDQEYINGCSIVLYYRHGSHTLLIPADINPSILKYILNDDAGTEKRCTRFDRKFAAAHPTWHERTDSQPSLSKLLGDCDLSILFAPHHGLESGFSKDLYDAMHGGKPGLVVISDKRKTSNSGNVDARYASQNGSRGQTVLVDGKKEHRHSISTKNGHHILIAFQGSGGRPQVWLESDPYQLLKHIS